VNFWWRGEFLQKLFPTFPGEWPGVGLLLLRALVGLSLSAQGVAYVQSTDRSLWMLLIATLSFIGGGFLLIGLMTPLVAVLVVLGDVSIALSLIPLPTQDLFNSNLVIIDLIVLALAIAFLGPGAFSVDARMFGRREITIPSHTHVSRQ
jgi:putative oxidoreductase